MVFVSRLREYSKTYGFLRMPHRIGDAKQGKINDKTPVYTLTRRLISLASLPRLQHSFRFCGSIQ